MPRQTILIVEDDDDLRGFYATVLGLEGYATRQAPDGLAALRIVESSPPDLVLLDLSLPLISGVVVYQEIAEQAVTRHIPVVVITAAAPETLDPVKMPCVLHKPVTSELLLQTVRECLDSAAPTA
jgi:CheY-like chemotaxis protein